MKENWLFIKTPDDYGNPEIIQIENNIVNYFSIENSDETSLIKTEDEIRNEKLTETEHTFINQNRIRFFKKGKIHTVLNDDKSINEDCTIENDYEKLKPTETQLTESEIQNLKFDLCWNGEKINVRFNEDLDTPLIQEINKRLNKEESRVLLKKLNETLFLSFHTDIYWHKLIPIKYVDKEKIILYGFPKEPYEVNCTIIN